MGLQDYIFIFKLGQKVLEFNLETAKAIVLTVKKVVDSTGKAVTKFFRSIDTDGDGVFDSEVEICSLDGPFPVSLDNGLTLVNKGREIGLGLPDYKLADANDVLPILQGSDGFISGCDQFIIDLDNDGATDEVIAPLPFDGTGDGLPDFQVIVDDDDNGLPDVSPDSPFYPIGSKEYQEIIEVHTDNVPALDKSFKNYTVTEALLFLIFIGSAIGVVSKIFKRRKM